MSFLSPRKAGSALRELRPEDAPALFELIREEAAAGRLSGGGAELELRDAELFILSALLTAGDDYRAVCDGEGRFLGLIGLKDICPERAEFRIALTREGRGRGLARAATEELLRQAFSRPEPPERIFMYTRPDNEETNGFNRALGFRRQEPEADAPADVRDLNWYGLTRPEFLSRG